MDFWQYANAFKLFGTPFQTYVEEVEKKYQLELINLQCDKFLKARYDSVSTVEFYQKYVAPRKKLSNLLQNAKIMTSLFASTYCCEQLFSKMKYTKTYLRSSLHDDHLEDILMLSTTNISADVETLSKTKQH